LQREDSSRDLSTANLLAKIPLYFNTAPLLTEQTAYQGVLRFSPALGATHNPQNHWSFEAYPTFDVLGQRSLFSRALEWRE
jgi:hypothetical protein